MFDFIFKRSGNKPAPAATASSAPAAAAPVQAQAQAEAARRRAEQLARAQGLAGDEAGASALLLQSEFADVRLAAAEHVHSRALLEQVHLAVRNSDRRVAKLVQGRLDLIRHEAAEQQRAQLSIAQAQRLLADEKLSPNQVADLDRQWLVIKPNADLAGQFADLRHNLGQRLEAQVTLQRAALDTLAAVRRLPQAGLEAEAATQQLQLLADAHAAHLADAEHATLPKHLAADFAVAYTTAQAALHAGGQLQAALAARQAALAEWQAAEPAALGGEQIRRSWQGLPALPDTDAGRSLQLQYEALAASVAAAHQPQPRQAVAADTADAEAQAGDAGTMPGATSGAPAKPAKAAKADTSTGTKEALQAFVAALDGMEAALQQGLLQVASEHDKALRDIKTGRLAPAQSERLAHVRAEFKRLADWARWGGNVSREELVKAADEMPEQGLPVTELAKKVGSLRERWKSLDTLSGPAPKSLWERFDAACTKAYAPAAAHFKQLGEERHNNAAKARELVAEALALGAAAGADWKQIAATAQRLRQAWTRLGTVERKDKKRLDGEFEQALEVLSAPLEQQRQVEIARREQLIAEVAQLKPTERNTLDMLRALQEKWQEQAKALPLERRVEQALWQRFRAACDEVFAKRKETANAADHERKAHLAAKEAVCAGLETAEVPEEGGEKLSDKRQAAAFAALLRDARSAWNQAGPVPRAAEQKIEQRYQAAIAGIQAKAEALAQRAGAALANALRDKLRLCQAIESRVVEQDATVTAADDELGARWSALPPLDSDYERALQGRFAGAQLALAQQDGPYARLLEANRGALLEEVLRLEIVAGVDSGAEFARERLKMQVEVLQSSLKSGQKPVAQHGQLLALCALPALADARTVSRIEVLLRRMGSVAAAK